MRVMTVLMPFTKKVYMTIMDTLYVHVFDANTLEFIFVLMKQAMSPSGSSFYSVFFFMSAPKEDLLSKRVIKQSVCDSFYGGALFVEGAVFLNLATVIQK